jgi:hypothetical protein
MEAMYLLILLFSSWGVVTAVLIVVLMYRAILSSKEEDQIFIDAAEQHDFQHRQAIIVRMSGLNEHATKHIHTSKRPIMRLPEAREDRDCCYIDEVEIDFV